MEKKTYQKILLALDGSELASSAVPHAYSIAAMCNADIVLLRVIPSVAQTMLGLAPGEPPPVPDIAEAAFAIAKEAKKNAKHQLEKVKAELLKNGVKNVEVAVEEGYADTVIVDVAKQRNCELIVMSTHGRSVLGRAFLGSVADHVIRNAHCPVLVVHPVTKAA